MRESQNIAVTPHEMPRISNDIPPPPPPPLWLFDQSRVSTEVADGLVSFWRLGICNYVDDLLCRWLRLLCHTRHNVHGSQDRYSVMLHFHYIDIIMSAMPSQITSITIVYSTVYSGAVKKKTLSKLRVTGLCAGNSPVAGEFPAQRDSNAENVSIWWSHHVYQKWEIVTCRFCGDVALYIIQT